MVRTKQEQTVAVILAASYKQRRYFFIFRPHLLLLHLQYSRKKMNELEMDPSLYEGVSRSEMGYAKFSLGLNIHD